MVQPARHLTDLTSSIDENKVFTHLCSGPTQQSQIGLTGGTQRPLPPHLKLPSTRKQTSAGSRINVKEPIVLQEGPYLASLTLATASRPPRSPLSKPLMSSARRSTESSTFWASAAQHGMARKQRQGSQKSQCLASTASLSPRKTRGPDAFGAVADAPDMDVVARGLSAHALLHSEEDSDLRVHLALHAEGTEWQEILNPIPRDPETALAISGDFVRSNTFEHRRKNSAVDDAAALGLSLSGITVTPRFAHEDEKETDQALIGKTNDRSCKQELAADTAEGQCSLDGQTGIASDVDTSSPRLVLNVSMPGVPLRQAEAAQIVGWRGRSATGGEAARVDGAVSQSTDEEVAPQGIAQRRRAAEERVSTPRDALDKGVNKAWPDMMISASGIDLFLMLMTSLFDPSTHCLPHAPTDSVDFCYPQTHTHTHTHTQELTFARGRPRQPSQAKVCSSHCAHIRASPGKQPIPFRGTRAMWMEEKPRPPTPKCNSTSCRKSQTRSSPPSQLPRQH